MKNSKNLKKQKCKAANYAEMHFLVASKAQFNVAT